MTIKTSEDYLAALRAMRPNVHRFGELIHDVTTYPATKRSVESHARNYDAANDQIMGIKEEVAEPGRPKR